MLKDVLPDVRATYLDAKILLYVGEAIMGGAAIMKTRSPFAVGGTVALILFTAWISSYVDGVKT